MRSLPQLIAVLFGKRRNGGPDRRLVRTDRLDRGVGDLHAAPGRVADSGGDVARVALAGGIMDRVTYQDPPEDAS